MENPLSHGAYDNEDIWWARKCDVLPKKTQVVGTLAVVATVAELKERMRGCKERRPPDDVN